MRWLIVGAWLLAGGVLPARAGEVAVQVVDARALPVGDAVVTLTPDTAAGPTAQPAVTHYVDQKDETFVPYVQVLAPGDRVVFRNSDRTRHHVYSFSPVKAFEFMLRPGESSPELRLPQPGIVAVGCNIHDHMIAYLVVSAGRAQVTGSQGRAVFDHLPPGGYTVHVWHPQLRPGREPPEAKTRIADAAEVQAVSFTLTLVPDPRSFADREHLDY